MTVINSEDLEFNFFFHFQKTCITLILFTITFIQSPFLKFRGPSNLPALHLANFCEECERPQPETCGCTCHSTVSCEKRKKNRFEVRT